LKILTRILLFFFFIHTTVFANYANTYQYDNVKKDFEDQNFDKYTNDNLQTLVPTTLVAKGIINTESQLTVSSPSASYSTLPSTVKCSFVNAEYTATIYDINPMEGKVTCMVSKSGDVYNPIGLFEVAYPDMASYFKKNIEDARVAKSAEIASSDTQFSSVYSTRKTLGDSITSVGSSTYLPIPQLLMAGILTDIDIIDIETTTDTGKLQLKSGYTSKYTDELSSGTITDNAESLLVDVENIFANYKDLSNLSMDYLLILVLFFGVFAGVKFLGGMAGNAIEKTGSGEKKLPFGAGILLGIILFFPMNDGSGLSSTGSTTASYDIMKTRYQEFEQAGYYIFQDWASDTAKAIIDNELDSVIDKSGVGTGEQIAQTYAGMEQYDRLTDFATSISNNCSNTYYDTTKMINSEKKYIYTNNENVIFPSSENWAYATSMYVGGATTDYYNSVGAGGLVKSGGSASAYPRFSMSGCGRLIAYSKDYKNKYDDYVLAHEKVVGSDPTVNAKKIKMLKNLIKFQYQLYKDYSYLSILGLPIIKMQTEYVGGLYTSEHSALIDTLSKEVGKDGQILHTIMSSIPYMFIPGASTVYTAGVDNAGKIGGAIGGAVGGLATGGFLGWATGAVGGAVGYLFAPAVGMLLAYNTGKTILGLAPIIGLVVIGLLRFLIIIIKIFTFHFASLFLLPIMFARENITAISKFSMKVIATMLELPLFVLAIWLAMTANGLLHSIGDVFSKRIMIGMLDYNHALYTGTTGVTSIGGIDGWLAKLKLYVFDGFMEIVIAVFGIVIIYKIIISLHNVIMEIFEVQGNNTLDNTIESMKQESSGYGAKI
jgi:hypothetical protein